MDRLQNHIDPNFDSMFIFVISYESMGQGNERHIYVHSSVNSRRMLWYIDITHNLVGH